jgi:hypothetical protein
MNAISKAREIHGLNKAHPLLDLEKDYSVYFLGGAGSVRKGFPKHSAEARQHET